MLISLQPVIAMSEFLGYPIPDGHPVLSSSWIGEELVVGPDGQVWQNLAHVQIDATGNYQAQEYVRNNQDGRLRLGEPWRGRLYWLSDNQFCAWNEGDDGRHGYWVIFDPTFTTATATLFSDSTPGVESVRLTRTLGSIAPIVAVIEAMIQRSP